MNILDCFYLMNQEFRRNRIEHPTVTVTKHHAEDLYLDDNLFRSYRRIHALPSKQEMYKAVHGMSVYGVRVKVEGFAEAKLEQEKLLDLIRDAERKLRKELGLI